MASITLDLPQNLYDELTTAAGSTAGLSKYFEEAIGLKKLVDKETGNDNLIAVADKSGKVLRTIRTSKSGRSE